MKKSDGRVSWICSRDIDVVDHYAFGSFGFAERRIESLQIKSQ